MVMQMSGGVFENANVEHLSIRVHPRPKMFIFKAYIQHIDGIFELKLLRSTNLLRAKNARIKSNLNARIQKQLGGER